MVRKKVDTTEFSSADKTYNVKYTARSIFSHNGLFIATKF